MHYTDPSMFSLFTLISLSCDFWYGWFINKVRETIFVLTCTYILHLYIAPLLYRRMITYIIVRLQKTEGARIYHLSLLISGTSVQMTTISMAVTTRSPPSTMNSIRTTGPAYPSSILPNNSRALQVKAQTLDILWGDID